ncbi:MAG: hypothetical protein WBY94_24580 [Polyangiaceae bacterium]
MRVASVCIFLELVACEPIAAAIAPSTPPFPGSIERGPEKACDEACAKEALHCTRRDCSRGCNLVLDRLAEKEGASVVACVAKSTPQCDDRAWAACAARIGEHADGGPPPPPPPPSDETFDE